MGLKKFKPVTAGQRFKLVSNFEEITTSTPEKSLLLSKKRTGGRNNEGKMTMRYIGGGHKKQYRIIDFLRNKDGVPATVKTIEYDPNRSARIALYRLPGRINAPNRWQMCWRKSKVWNVTALRKLY